MIAGARHASLHGGFIGRPSLSIPWQQMGAAWQCQFGMTFIVILFDVNNNFAEGIRRNLATLGRSSSPRLPWSPMLRLYVHRRSTQCLAQEPCRS
jgi:hypothetical protein